MYQPYVATHKKWDHVGNLTPNVEISEGVRPAEELKPAAYLKLVRFDKYLEDYFVVSAGKVVALDGNNDVVPAGLRLQATNFLALWTAGVASGGTVTVQDVLTYCRTSANWAGDNYTAYDSIDLQQGIIDINAPAVLNAAGATVENTELVVESFFDVTIGGTAYNLGNLTAGQLAGAKASVTAIDQSLSVSYPIGIAPFNYFRWAGGDGFNPAQYNLHNYNMQHQVTVLCDYYIELPRIDDKGDIVFTGLAVLHDASLDLAPGDFLTYDEDSDMVAGGSSCMDIVGQAWKIDTSFPKDYLDRVRTAYKGLGDLDKMPGSANAGLPDNVSYAGGTAAKGVVRINLINR